MSQKKNADHSGSTDRVLEGLDEQTWEAPPEEVLRRVRRMEDSEVLPEPEESLVESCAPEDVRAAAAAIDDGDEVVITRSHEDADLTITIQPPDGEGDWMVSGRIWLRQESEEPMQVALVHETHVLAAKRVENGEYFEFEEVLPRQWYLEVHLPTGACLRIDDLLS